MLSACACRTMLAGRDAVFLRPPISISGVRSVCAFDASSLERGGDADADSEARLKKRFMGDCLGARRGGSLVGKTEETTSGKGRGKGVKSMFRSCGRCDGVGVGAEGVRGAVLQGFGSALVLEGSGAMLTGSEAMMWSAMSSVLNVVVWLPWCAWGEGFVVACGELIVPMEMIWPVIASSGWICIVGKIRGGDVMSVGVKSVLAAVVFGVQSGDTVLERVKIVV